MIAPRTASLVAALTLTAPVTLLAQEEPPVAPGDRVRVTAPTNDPARLVGTLVALGADTCVLELGGGAGTLALPLADVTNLEVSRGQKSRAWLYAVIGGLAGMVFVAYQESEAEEREDAYGWAIAAYTLVVIGGGAGIGALIGSNVKSDRWVDVPLDRVRVSIVPQPRGGLVVSASIRL